jgi:hypothetical protein
MKSGGKTFSWIIMYDASTQLTYIAVGSSSFLLTLIALTIVLSVLRRARLNDNPDVLAIDPVITRPQRRNTFEIETVEAPVTIIGKPSSSAHIPLAPRHTMSDQVTILIVPDDSANSQRRKAQRRNVQRIIAHLKPGIETELQAS